MMIKINIFAAVLLALAAIVAIAPTSHAQSPAPDFYLHDGDRVVMYGDSITDQRLYTVWTEDYVTTRFPKLNISWTDSGWGGDKVTGGGGGPIDQRIRRDILPYKPTVVTIMLGMNDGGYRAFDQGFFDTYSKGYIHILDSVNAGDPGVRYTLIIPSPYDDFTRAPGFDGGYNSVLIKYGQFVSTLPQKYPTAIIADFNTPMVNMLTAAKQKDAALSQKILPDRVHPTIGAHLVMAEALLKSWNAPSTVASVSIDAPAKAIIHAVNSQVTKLTGDKSGIS